MSTYTKFGENQSFTTAQTVGDRQTSFQKLRFWVLKTDIVAKSWILFRFIHLLYSFIFMLM